MKKKIAAFQFMTSETKKNNTKKNFIGLKATKKT
jgi:hypothetical protein